MNIMNGQVQHANETTERPRRPHVVIVGAGFGGLEAAKVLAGKEADVTIVDRNNYHKFQPLLYQVATAGLDAGEIAHAVRDIFRGKENVRFELGTVQRVDKEARKVILRSGREIAYDVLILAAGAVSTFFGVEGAREHGFPLKTIPDAIDLRNHVLRQFERYSREGEGAGPGALTFVVVGGGPTGVETAGALTELFDLVLQGDYHSFDTTQARVVLIEMGPRLLAEYSEAQSDYTRRVLEGRGVEVRTDEAVTRVEPESVTLKSGERIPMQTLIWGAGVRASPLADTLGTEQAEAGRLKVNNDLSLPGYPEIFAVGDLSAGEDEGGEMYAQLAQVAIQQGRHAARQALHHTQGQPTEPFRYTDLGKMATIGRNAAVAELPGGIRFQGFPAWFAWVFVHIAKLVGFRNRASVFASWMYNYFTYKRNARLILDVVPLPSELPLEVEEVDRQVRARLSEIAEEEEKGLNGEKGRKGKKRRVG